MRIEWFHSQRNSLATIENNNIKSKNTATNEMVYDQTTEQVEIIGFQDEGRQEDLIAPIQNTNIPNVLVQASTHEQKNHTIPGFLQRAYQIDNFQWATTDTPGTVLKQYRFPDVLLKQPALARKAFNFFGLRAGVEFIVLVNKQQFQQGNLLISFLPGAKYNPAKDAMCQSTDPASNVNLTTLTGMPRTNLDLMDATRSDLTVPYASPYIYYNLLTGDGTIGDFYITVYSQLGDVAADGTVSVQVMARFVDVDLQFPAGTDMTSFSVVPKIDHLFSSYTQKPDIKTLKALVEEGEQILEQVKNGSFRFQMNSEKLVTLNFKPKALPNMAVADEFNNAHLLALSSNNSLPSANMGEASQSEMDFRKIVQIPVYFDRFNIKSNDAGGKNVWSRKVELLNYANKINDTYGVDYITFLGQNFSKWRSSFIYHFRFVKTTFHSLRVRIFFAPNATSETGVDRNAVISKIIDLKDNNFVEFEVPFIWPHPFLSTDSSFSHSLGIIGVDVLTKMVNPATVKNQIEVIVERSAGTDFCVNLPKELTYFPFDPIKETRYVVPIITPSKKSTSHSQEDYSNNTLKPISEEVAIGSRDKRELSVDETDGWIRDLTEEGIEPNPGPIFSDHWLSSTSSTERTLDIGGSIGQVVRIVLFHTYGGATTSTNWTEWTFDDNKLSTISVYDATVSFDYILTAPDLKFSVISGAANIGQAINVFTGVSAASTSVNVANVPLQVDIANPVKSEITNIPLQVDVTTNPVLSEITNIPLQVDIKTNPVMSQITNVPLPVTGGGGGGTASIVATRSDQPTSSFKFQMNHEQDDYRPGYDDTSYIRPVKSVQADNLVLGAPVSSINEMINRSSLMTTFEPLTINDIYLMPHFIGICKKDASNNNIYEAADMLSYYASAFAFARGGVNLKLATSPDFFYNAVLDPDAKTLSTTDTAAGAQKATATPATMLQQQQVSLQQVVKPSLEGFGEITIPFYSDTFMYYVNPVISQNPSKTMQTMQLPFTTTIIRSYGQLERVQVYRAACKDFELSYLTGPPRMVSMV